jgi:hypothetical protein
VTSGSASIATCLDLPLATALAAFAHHATVYHDGANGAFIGVMEAANAPA